MKRLATVCACLLMGSFLRAGNCDEAALKVAGTGDFADRALHSFMMGAARTDGRAMPDLFAIKDKFYGQGITRYEFLKYEAGVPVFEFKGMVGTPKGVPVNAKVLEKDGRTFLFWFGNGLNYAVFNPVANEFRPLGTLPAPDMKPGPGIYELKFNAGGGLDVWYAGTTVHEKSTRPAWRTAEYRPYDATGVWMAGVSYNALYHYSYPDFNSGKPTEVERISSEREIMHSVAGMCIAAIDGKEGLVVTTRDGGFWFYATDGSSRTRIVDSEGNAMRSPSISPHPAAYPSETPGKQDIITMGEGGVFHYVFTGERTPEGKIIVREPVPAKEKDPTVYAGTLVTPTVADWDGDGVLDVLCGNSAGYILYFHNVGTNESPSFVSGTRVCAGGRPIHIQPGYGEDIQGPGEARWGYVGANVCDWNQDGILDIITNDSRAKHMVFRGTKDGLEPEHPIYLDDLPLHGMWRCRPGVGTLDGRMAYITLDDDDEFHLYWREDDYNLLDGFKLRLTDGRSIRANHLEAGGKGRVRFEIADWDGDGVKDLVIATNRHHTIPMGDPHALPWTNPKGEEGSTILFMRNAGSESEPVYEFPRQMRYKGRLIRLGHHACGASVAKIGHLTDGLPNIIAGDETGRLYLFERQYLTW